MKPAEIPVINNGSGILKKDNLNNYTFARVGLPKAGFAISMKDVLSFRADHAAARDAISTPFEIKLIQQNTNFKHAGFLNLASNAKSQNEYLQRPDLGRTPDAESMQQLQQYPKNSPDIVFVVTNGLSAQAVNEYAAILLNTLVPELQATGYTVAPIVFVTNGRVAIADTIGETLQVRLSIILVGERPGLSSPDSMGAYLTFNPKQGYTDEKRNCISNIRSKGLPPVLAAQKLLYLIKAALTQQISGVYLKDEMGLI